MPPQDSPATRLRAVPDLAALGFTKPNSAGRQYRHGTMSGYNAGKCRCTHCKDAAAIYRAAAPGGREGLSPQTPDGGHRRPHPARLVPAEGLAPRTRAGRDHLPGAPHDLRHAHASWLLAGGADLQMVKDRLGHGSISTTEKYLHTLPEADDLALDAFSKIRNRGK